MWPPKRTVSASVERWPRRHWGGCSKGRWWGDGPSWQLIIYNDLLLFRLVYKLDNKLGVNKPLWSINYVLYDCMMVKLVVNRT